MHEGVLAYYAQKSQWLPVYPSISQMPVEVGECFFMCMSCDQAKDHEQMMLNMAAQAQKELIAALEK